MLAELRELCPVVLAVHGNVDDAELRRGLPESLSFEIAGRAAALSTTPGPARVASPGSATTSPKPTRSSSATATSPSTKRRAAFKSSTPAADRSVARAPEVSMGLLHADPSGLSFEHLWLG